jgi:hypothetical protein
MHDLDARINIAGEVSTIRDFALRGKITPYHAMGFARDCWTGEAFFADVETRGGWPAGPEITKKAFEELRKIVPARRAASGVAGVTPG